MHSTHNPKCEPEIFFQRYPCREWTRGRTPESPLVPDIGPQTLTVAWRKAADAAGYPNYWLREARNSYGVRVILAGYPL